MASTGFMMPPAKMGISQFRSCFAPCAFSFRSLRLSPLKSGKGGLVSFHFFIASCQEITVPVSRNISRRIIAGNFSGAARRRRRDIETTAVLPIPARRPASPVTLNFLEI